MADGLFSSIYKAAVPVNARMVLEHLAGSKAPITEKDFTPEELAALRQAIAETQQGNADREAVYRANLKKTKKEYEQNPEYYPRNLFGDTNYPEGAKPYKVWKEEQKRAVQSFEKTRDKTSIGYGSYDIKSGDMAAPVGQDWLDAIYQSYTDPAFRMAATLGSANYYDKKGQTPYVSDTYGFTPHPEAYDGYKPNMSVLDIINTFKGTPGAMFEVLASKIAPHRRTVNIALPPEQPTNVQYRDPFAPTIK